MVSSLIGIISNRLEKLILPSSQYVPYNRIEQIRELYLAFIMDRSFDA
jgi:hypothetical protein